MSTIRDLIGQLLDIALRKRNAAEACRDAGVKKSC